MGRLGNWPHGLGDGPHGLGNGPHGIGNGPHGLGNGPHGLGNGPHGLVIAIYCYLYHGDVREGGFFVARNPVVRDRESDFRLA